MQFADVKDASQQGKKKGETFTWDVVSNLPRADRALVETNTVAESNFTITQGTLTVTEAAVAVPYSGKLEDLAMLPVRKPVMTALRNDAKKTFDRAAYAQMYLTPLRVAPTGGTSLTEVTLTTNGTCTLTSSAAFTINHAKSVNDLMQERNIPAYTGDDYMAIAWPSTLRQLRTGLETIHQYTESGIKLIFNGELGRYENFRFVKQTNVSKGITATGSSGVAWSSATAIANDWIFFLGEDTVAEGIAIPEEMRAKIPTDFGRSKGVAWYYIGGFGIVHTNATQARIVMWDTAA